MIYNCIPQISSYTLFVLNDKSVKFVYNDCISVVAIV